MSEHDCKENLIPLHTLDTTFCVYLVARCDVCRASYDIKITREQAQFLHKEDKKLEASP